MLVKVTSKSLNAKFPKLSNGTLNSDFGEIYLFMCALLCLELIYDIALQPSDLINLIT